MTKIMQVNFQAQEHTPSVPGVRAQDGLYSETPYPRKQNNHVLTRKPIKLFFFFNFVN